jgi:hypothetical protein
LKFIHLVHKSQFLPHTEHTFESSTKTVPLNAVHKIVVDYEICIKQHVHNVGNIRFVSNNRYIMWEILDLYQTICT